MDLAKGRAIRMDARDLTHNLVSRDWQEYADACYCHDQAEPAVQHVEGPGAC